MKRKLPLLLLLLMTCGIILPLKAQTTTPLLQPLHFTINGGYGFPNIEGHSFATYGNGSNSGRFSPFYAEFGYNYSQNGMVAIYFSVAGASTGNFQWFDTSNVSHTFSYSVTMTTIGISYQYYLRPGKHLCPYFGGMIGYLSSDITTNGDLTIGTEPHLPQPSFSYHVYLGAAYYLNSWAGLDARAGYGNWYYASIGLSFRLTANRD